MNALAARAKTDAAARERLFVELADWIKWAARRYAKILKEDGPSEIAVAILEALRSYDEELGPFRGWALGAIVFRLRDACRRERKYRQRTVQFKRPDFVIDDLAWDGSGAAPGSRPGHFNQSEDEVVIAGRDVYGDGTPAINVHVADDKSIRALEEAENRADIENAIRRAGARLTDAQRAALARRMAGEIRREDKDLVYRALQILEELNRC